MKITYNKEVDILYLQFSEAAIEGSDKEKPGMIIDYDASGNIVGIEYLSSSQRMVSPEEVLYEVENK